MFGVWDNLSVFFLFLELAGLLFPPPPPGFKYGYFYWHNNILNQRMSSLCPLGATQGLGLGQYVRSVPPLSLGLIFSQIFYILS